MPFSEEELESYLTQNFMKGNVINQVEQTEDKIEIPSKQEEEIYDNNSIIDERVIFKYLDNDSLSLDIQHKRDYLKKYNLRLSLYNTDQSKRLPFIQYYMNLENNKYTFPKKELHMKPFIEIYENRKKILPGIFSKKEEENDDTDENAVDIEFLDQIARFYTEVTNEEFNETMYKGFLEDENDNIYIFLDISESPFSKYTDMTNILMDEILNVSSVYDVEIDSEIIEMFRMYKFLHNLKTVEDYNVQFPKLGYICDEGEEGYVNIFKDEDDDLLLIPPTIDHEMYDNIYLFSSMPLSVSNVSKIRRYACFIENENDENTELDNISFTENDTQFYGFYELDLFKEI